MCIECQQFLVITRNRMKNQENIYFFFQGCAKDGTAPDGRSYLEAAETEEIKSLLK